MSVVIPQSLALLCQQHGIELSGLSDAEIAEQLPSIFAAVASQNQDNRILLAKSAELVQFAGSGFANPGLERDETLLALDSPTDPNAPLNRLFPW